MGHWPNLAGLCTHFSLLKSHLQAKPVRADLDLDQLMKWVVNLPEFRIFPPQHLFFIYFLLIISSDLGGAYCERNMLLALLLSYNIWAGGFAINLDNIPEWKGERTFPLCYWVLLGEGQIPTDD